MVYIALVHNLSLYPLIMPSKCLALHLLHALLLGNASLRTHMMQKGTLLTDHKNIEDYHLMSSNTPFHHPEEHTTWDDRGNPVKITSVTYWFSIALYVLRQPNICNTIHHLIICYIEKLYALKKVRA